MEDAEVVEVAPRTMLALPGQVMQSIEELAKSLNVCLGEGEWVVCPVLVGGLVFAGKLFTYLRGDLTLHPITTKRYRGTQGSELSIDGQLAALQGKNVLLLDEIFDEGKTLEGLRECLLRTGVAKILTAVLVQRKGAAKVDYRPDFVGLEISSSAFMVGEGMDCNGKFRNLRGVWAL